MSDSKVTWVFLTTATLALAWGIWLKLNEAKPAGEEVEWVIRGGKLVERESSRPFEGAREVPFEGTQDLIQWQYHYVDGIRHGAATEFFSGPGKLVKSRENYIDGKRQGTVTTYHDNGVPESVGEAVDGFLEGLVTFYDRDGTIASRSVYTRSLPSGVPAISVDPMLTPEPEKIYGADNPEPDEPEPRAFLNPDGMPFTGTQIGTFFGGARAFEHPFIDGLEDGLQRGWNPDGEGEYEQPFAAGKPHGTWKTWGHGGQLLSEKHFAHGRPIGSSKAWFPDGRLRGESAFVHGAEHGTRTNYDTAGNRRRVTTFDHGIQVALQEWDRDGQLVRDEASPLPSGANLHIEPGDTSASKSVPLADLPDDIDGEITVRFRYRLSTGSAEPASTADPRRAFKASMLHDGQPHEFNSFAGQLGGWRDSEWIVQAKPGEPLTLLVEAEAGALAIDIDGLRCAAADE